MKYLQLIGIVLFAWGLNILITLAFNSYTKGEADEYARKLVDNSGNIVFYGLLGVGGLFLGNLFGGWLTYLIFGISTIIVIFGLIPLIIIFVTNIPLSFVRNYHGIMDTGKLSDWIFFLSSFVDSSIMIFIIYRMFVEFF